MTIEAAPPTKPARPWVAALLSLCAPGAGLWYAGRPIAALVVAVASLALPFALLLAGLAAGLSARPLLFLAMIVLVGLFVAQLVLAALAARSAATRASAWQVALFVVGLMGVSVALPPSTDVVEPFRIVSNSMAPGLVTGDRLMVDRWRGPDVRRGDVVAFLAPDAVGSFAGAAWIQRVVAKGGDVVELQGHDVWVNGKSLRSGACAPSSARPFASDLEDPECVLETSPDGVTYAVVHDSGAAIYGPEERRVEVPAGHVFLLGDNRDRASDSRRWGTLPEGNVLGRSLGMYWEGDGSSPFLDPAAP